MCYFKNYLFVIELKSTFVATFVHTLSLIDWTYTENIIREIIYEARYPDI